MDIELTVRGPKGSLTGWRHQIAGGGAPTVTKGDTATVTVADGTNATLKILPPAPKAASPAWKDDPTAYWPLDLAITWNGTQANVADPYHQIDVSRAGGRLMVSVVMSRVRDASALFAAVLNMNDWPPEPTNRFLYARRNGPRSAGFQPGDLIDEAGKIRRVAPLDGISADDDNLLFEIAPPRKLVKGQEKLSLDFRPKLVGGYFGTQVTSAKVLVYYYPQIDQDDTFNTYKSNNNLRRDSDDPDDARLGVIHYPKAGEHLGRVIYGKLFYQRDPWTARQQYLAGAAHQVAAAARPAGIVIPIPDLEPVPFGDGGMTALSLGVAVFPEELNEIVREIWAYVQCRRLRQQNATQRSQFLALAQVVAKAVGEKASSPSDPAIALAASNVKAMAAAAADSANRPAVTDVRKNASLDRVMVSGFSNGNHFLSQLAKRIKALSSPASLPFRDFLALDPPSMYSAVEQHIRDACDKLPDSRVYYYWRYGYDIATRENGKPRSLKGTGAYQVSVEGRYFYAHLPSDSWPLKTNNDMDMHAWVDATMICDAFKCSTFPINRTKAVP